MELDSAPCITHSHITRQWVVAAADTAVAADTTVVAAAADTAAEGVGWVLHSLPPTQASQNQVLVI